jgi:hypothetical protein
MRCTTVNNDEMNGNGSASESRMVYVTVTCSRTLVAVNVLVVHQRGHLKWGNYVDLCFRVDVGAVSFHNK